MKSNHKKIYAPSCLSAPQLDRALPLLGGLSIRKFFETYWQKKPLLIRQAIPHFQPPISRQELFSLASQEEVESRLIRCKKQQWSLKQGPFHTNELPSLKQGEWTLLVQGVNLHHRGAHELLQQFRFISDSRLDDLMVSFATDGGGVGPHFDSYDVFLLQAMGTRRWEISEQTNLAYREDLPLKILSEFKAQKTWLLNPGDILYLPPHIAHNGIAQGPGMTYSIGFRAMNAQELSLAFLDYLADTLVLKDQLQKNRYSDAKRQPNRVPAQIDETMVTYAYNQLQHIQWNQQDILKFLGEYLSNPKSSTFFVPPQKAKNFKNFLQQSLETKIVVHPKTRILYCGSHIFINGESVITKGVATRVLQNLANQHYIHFSELNIKKSNHNLLRTLYNWYCAGWLLLETT